MYWLTTSLVVALFSHFAHVHSFAIGYGNITEEELKELAQEINTLFPTLLNPDLLKENDVLPEVINTTTTAEPKTQKPVNGKKTAMPSPTTAKPLRRRRRPRPTTTAAPVGVGTGIRAAVSAIRNSEAYSVIRRVFYNIDRDLLQLFGSQLATPPPVKVKFRTTTKPTKPTTPKSKSNSTSSPGKSTASSSTAGSSDVKVTTTAKPATTAAPKVVSTTIEDDELILGSTPQDEEDLLSAESLEFQFISTPTKNNDLQSRSLVIDNVHIDKHRGH